MSIIMISNPKNMSNLVYFSYLWHLHNMSSTWILGTFSTDRAHFRWRIVQFFNCFLSLINVFVDLDQWLTTLFLKQHIKTIVGETVDISFLMYLRTFMETFVTISNYSVTNHFSLFLLCISLMFWMIESNLSTNDRINQSFLKYQNNFFPINHFIYLFPLSNFFFYFCILIF